MNNINKEVKEDKKRQIIYMFLVLLFIIILILVSLIYNNKISLKGDNKKLNTVENEVEISHDELFKQVEEAQTKRAEEAEKYIKKSDLNLDITLDDFEEKVLKADKPVLIDYYAAWCSPCHMMSPIVAELAKEQNDFYVYKVNVDIEVELATIEKIASIPTFIVYKDGKKVNTQLGVQTKEQLIELVNKK